MKQPTPQHHRRVPLHLAIVDRCELFRESLGDLLVTRGHRIVWSSDHVRALPPAADIDALLVDVATAMSSGQQLAHVRSTRPALRILALGDTSSDDTDGAVGAASGLVDAVLDRTVGLLQLERAAAGLTIPGAATRPAPQQFRGAAEQHADRFRGAALTTREEQVLALLTAGAGTDAVADRLGITRSTVYAHVRSLLLKAGVRTRLELVARHVQGDLAAGPSSDEPSGRWTR